MPDNDRDQPMKRHCLALFPGAFRPPHAAHLTAVLDLASRPDIDEVVVIIANRSRLIPGTTKAFDAHLARRLWLIYLEDIADVRIDIAPHAAVRHALGYFERMQAGDKLVFCIGEADFEQGDERFETIRSLSERTGVKGEIIAAPTGSLDIRATTLRAALGLGKAGRETFIAALPAHLTTDQRDQVWRLCQTGMREVGEVIQEKVTAHIDGLGLGNVVDLNVVKAGKLDPVYRARLADGRCLYVKYAGDTVEPGSLGNAFNLKPYQRLATERRALKVLHAEAPGGIGGIQLPDVVNFDKETRTLVMTDACPGGFLLLDDFKRGIFSSKVASLAAGFLAHCHRTAQNLRPLWGDEETEQKHWQRMLALRTVDLAGERTSACLRRDLDGLMQVSLQASGRHFLHLDYSPKNILVGNGKLGVIDFELSSSVGDPACDLGYFLGHYVLWGLCTSAHAPCQDATHKALGMYRQVVGDLWPGMHKRVVAFAGASLLSSIMRDRQIEILGFERQVISTAIALLASLHNSADNLEQILSEAVAGRFLP